MAENRNIQFGNGSNVSPKGEVKSGKSFIAVVLDSEHLLSQITFFLSPAERLALRFVCTRLERALRSIPFGRAFCANHLPASMLSLRINLRQLQVVRLAIDVEMGLTTELLEGCPWSRVEFVVPAEGLPSRLPRRFAGLEAFENWRLKVSDMAAVLRVFPRAVEEGSSEFVTKRLRVDYYDYEDWVKGSHPVGVGVLPALSLIPWSNWVDHQWLRAARIDTRLPECFDFPRLEILIFPPLSLWGAAARREWLVNATTPMLKDIHLSEIALSNSYGYKPACKLMLSGEPVGLNCAADICIRWDLFRTDQSVDVLGLRKSLPGRVTSKTVAISSSFLARCPARLPGIWPIPSFFLEWLFGLRSPTPLVELHANFTFEGTDLKGEGGELCDLQIVGSNPHGNYPWLREHPGAQGFCKRLRFLRLERLPLPFEADLLTTLKNAGVALESAHIGHVQLIKLLHPHRLRHLSFNAETPDAVLNFVEELGSLPLHSLRVQLVRGDPMDLQSLQDMFPVACIEIDHAGNRYRLK